MKRDKTKSSSSLVKCPPDVIPTTAHFPEDNFITNGDPLSPCNYQIIDQRAYEKVFEQTYLNTLIVECAQHGNS